MLTIAVCDDDRDSLHAAAGCIHRWAEESGIPVTVHTYDNGDSLLDAAHGIHHDLVFLDILMPLLNGMDAARELRRVDAAARIVFLTSSPEFALESYAVKAQGYILKPVTEEKLREALEDCAAAVRKEPETLLLKTPFGYQKLYLHQIEYAEAQNKRVIFFLKDGTTAETAEPLYSFEDKLTLDNGFFKCHRSYFVYMPGVASFSSTQIVTSANRRVPIARGYARAFKEAYFAFMFGE